ncbi:MAG TPA: rod shape-determining protein MreD [Gemmatimonadaceae bacterium]|jgi:rod shape-determining protein MreD
MTLTGSIRAIATFAVLVLLHFTLRPFLDWRAPIDFLLLAVLTAAVRVRPAGAVAIGFLVGIAADSLAPDSLGAAALAMLLVAYLASWLKAVFFADSLPLNAMFFFVGKWIFDIVYFIAEHHLSGIDLVQQLLLWSPLSAAATAIAGVLVLLLMRPLLEPSPA